MYAVPCHRGLKVGYRAYRNIAVDGNNHIKAVGLLRNGYREGAGDQ